MKRLISICVICLLMMGLLPTVAVSAANGLSVTASGGAVTVGQNVTVTLTYDGGGQTIGGIKGSIAYDANVFTYVSYSGTDVQINGGAGKMIFIVTPSGVTGPTSATITLTFKADAPGSCTFAATTEEFVNDTDYSSLGAPSDSVTVTASNPTLSGNSNLKSLVPSRGTLTPKFDPNKTEYTITVSNSVESLSLSATPEHSAAKTAISGKNALQVGKNTRVVTVTAPNGTTKKYTVVINRAAAPTTTGSNTNAPTATKPTLPPEDALEVSVGGKTMTILDTQAPVDLPSGFVWDNVTVNRVDVPAAVNRDTGMVLLYLTSEEKTDDGFYIYDAEADTFTRYRRLSVAASAYLIYDLPAGQAAPAGTSVGSLLVDSAYVTAYAYEDAALSDFYIVWASPVNGEAGWYVYDAKEGTLQRYYAAPIGEDVTATTRPTTKPTAKTTGTTAKEKSTFTLASFMKENTHIWRIGLIAMGGIVVAVLIAILIVSLTRRGKGKH